MPTNEKILGFGNRWYKSAVQHATQHALTENIVIKLITAPYFLATKLEAFKARSNNDMFASHDFEDIITVIAGCSNIVKEISNAQDNIKEYINSELRNILNNPEFISILPGHLAEGPVSVTMQRVEKVINRMHEITQG